VENSAARTPNGFTLLQNYPNPFWSAATSRSAPNTSTAIGFQLSTASDIQLVIYNANGQLVRQVATGKFASGRHQVVWDGRDDHGRRVASGIYYYRMVAGALQSTKSMLLLR
jgi:flagellar hook assembly protein FlgD